MTNIWFTPHNDITQMLTGHGNFSSYLSRFNLKQPYNCTFCDQTFEDNFHILFHCPKHMEERERFYKETHIDLKKENMRKILSIQKFYECFVMKFHKIIDRCSVPLYVRKNRQRPNGQLRDGKSIDNC